MDRINDILSLERLPEIEKHSKGLLRYPQSLDLKGLEDGNEVVYTGKERMSILLLIVGVAVGIVFGSIPGLSAAMAVALFLPVTFAMQAHEAFTLLVALYIGGISGGLISAILINIPGTSSSIATCFDGSPMAKKGEAGKALYRSGILLPGRPVLLPGAYVRGPFRGADYPEVFRHRVLRRVPLCPLYDRRPGGHQHDQGTALRLPGPDHCLGGYGAH